MNIPDYPSYLNGEFTSLADAKISVLDRAFLFGDAIYDVVPLHNFRPFRFDEHMARMERGLRELRIENPLDRSGWRQMLGGLIARLAHVPEAATSPWLAYFQVSRGVALREHAMVRGLQPTCFAMLQPFPKVPEAQYRDGIRCMSAEDFRWLRSDVKSTSLLGAVMARQMSVDEGLADTILFRDGVLTEASASNAWVVREGRVIGAPKDHRVLEGIRYGILQQLCAAENIPFELRHTTREEVLSADELLLTSAVKKVMPVIELDGQRIGNGSPGPIFQRLRNAYELSIAQECSSQT